MSQYAPQGQYILPAEAIKADEAFSTDQLVSSTKFSTGQIDWRGVESEQVSFAKNYNRETGEVERQYHHRYPKLERTLTIVHLDEDPGLSETYNEGVKRANGEYVTTIVSDDIPHRTMISSLHALLHESGSDFAYSDEYIVDDAGRIIRLFEFPDFCPHACLADWYLLGNSKLWRKKLHEDCGYFSSEYPLTQDYELFARFFMAGAKFIHLPEVQYSLRFHGEDRKTGNHTTEREPKIYEESKIIADSVRSFLNQNTSE